MNDKARLSLANCRHLLGDRGSNLSDSTVASLRDGFYDLAHLAVALRPRQSHADDTALRHLPSEDREAIEERAAVLEFDAGMPRRAATQAAIASHRSTRARARPNSNRQ